MDVCQHCGQLAPLSAGPCTAQEFEDEIGRIETLMEQLAQRRTELRRKANMLAPISRLPPDILLDIFADLCQPVEADSSTKSTVSPTHAACSPLFLGSICAFWRSLLWSTPLLWREVTINVSFSQPSSQLQLLSEWLARAQTVPLHITLSAACDAIDEHEAIRMTSDVVEVLATRSAYWEQIDFLVPPRCHDTLLRNHFPALTSVRLRPPPGTIMAFNPPPDIFTTNTPSLLDVDLTGYDFSSMDLPWSQLRKFRAQFLTVSQCIETLRNSPNLIELHVEKLFIPDPHRAIQGPPSDRDSPFVHEALEVLDVGFIRGGAASELLFGLSLPALRELSLAFAGTDYWQSLIPLKCLAEVSSVAPRPWGLRKLNVFQNPLDEEGLAASLAVLPELVELEIHVAGDPTERLDSLHAMRNQLGGLSERLTNRLNALTEDGGAPSLPFLRRFIYEGPVLCPLMDVAGALSSRVTPFRRLDGSMVDVPRQDLVPLISASVLARQSFSQAENLTREDELHILYLGELGIQISQERNHKFW